jgi:hypothetical protein
MENEDTNFIYFVALVTEPFLGQIQLVGVLAGCGILGAPG